MPIKYYDFSAITALVVEDNEFMARLLREMLRSYGFGSILHAPDGTDGLEILRYAPIDLVLLDWMMEPVDGYQFCRTARRAPDIPNPAVPIILVTGCSDVATITKARDVGVTEVLVKPISSATLFDRIVTALERPRPFVRSRTYVGPDRRRRAPASYRGPERRSPSRAGTPALASEPKAMLTTEEVDTLLHPTKA